MMVEVRLEMMREEWVDSLFNEICKFESIDARQISWGKGRSSNEDDFIYFEIETDRFDYNKFKEELTNWLGSATLIRSITVTV